MDSNDADLEEYGLAPHGPSADAEKRDSTQISMKATGTFTPGSWTGNLGRGISWPAKAQGEVEIRLEVPAGRGLSLAEIERLASMR